MNTFVVSDYTCLILVVITLVLVLFNLAIALFYWIDGTFRTTYPVTLVPSTV